MDPAAPGPAAAAGTPPPPPPGPAGNRLTGYMFLVGFVTIACQILLVREIFTTLYASDVAVAIVLAAWTLTTGLGALAGRRPPARRAEHLLPLAPTVYIACVAAVFLYVRHWGAEAAVVTAGDYLRIPLWLALPCLLGGALFPLGLAAIRAAGDDPARAYAFETLGGLWAGLALTAYYRLGGTVTPALLALGVLTVLAAVVPAAGRHWGTVAGVSAVLLAVAASGIAAPVERAVLRLRYPGCAVLAYQETPFGTLTATATPTGNTAVYANGLPLPDAVLTPHRRALLGFLAQFPEACSRVLAIEPCRHGFGRLAEALPGTQLDLWEPDPFQLSFATRHGLLPDPRAATGVRVRTAASPWAGLAPGLDWIAVFADAPGSLAANRVLTAEFAARARACLGSAGVLTVTVPAAPGFLHPEQRAWMESVHAALRTSFAHTALFHTDLGYAVLVAATRPLPTTWRPERLRERLAGVTPGQEADVEAAFADGTSVLELPHERATTAAVRTNRVATPEAFFRSLAFRGRMVEGTAAWGQRLLRPQPLWLAVLVLLGVGLTVRITGRTTAGAPALFWGSWATTLTLMLSLYLLQSLTGQAYGQICLLTAGSMLGLFLGARACPAAHPAVRDGAGGPASGPPPEDLRPVPPTHRPCPSTDRVARGLARPSGPPFTGARKREPLGTLVTWYQRLTARTSAPHAVRGPGSRRRPGRARDRVPTPFATGRCSAAAPLLAAALFPALPVLERWPAAALTCVLLVANVLVSLRLGLVFAEACAAGPREAGVRTGAVLFAVDLAGAAGGLLLGAVLLPWWVGFKWAPLLSVAAVYLGPWRHENRGAGG